MVNCGRIPQKGHCYISAYDANTGQRSWKFTTVALTGQPGGDTWGKLPDDQRAGTETWIAGTYDPVLNTTYWGTAQAKPWRRDLRGSGDGATLFANSTLALDPDTGKLKWYFSHSPGEVARSRRSVRAHPDRSWQPEDGDDHRQGWHPVEAGPRDRQISGFARDGFPECFHLDRSQDRDTGLSQGHHCAESGSVAAILSRSRRRQGLAGGVLPPAGRRNHPSLEPDLRPDAGLGHRAVL